MRRSLLPDAMSVRVPLEDGFIRLGAGRKARASHVMGETAASDAWCVADMRGGWQAERELIHFPKPLWSFERGAISLSFLGVGGAGSVRQS